MNKYIKCPECKDGLILAEGRASMPVYIGSDGYGWWDFDACEIVDDVIYVCGDRCGFEHDGPIDDLVNVVKEKA